VRTRYHTHIHFLNAFYTDLCTKKTCLYKSPVILLVKGLGQGDDLYPLCLDLGDHFLEGGDGGRIGVAYPNGRAVIPGDADQLFQLQLGVPYIGFVVQEEIPRVRPQGQFLGDVISLALGCGTAVEEEELSPFQLAQHQAHLFPVFHESRSHVVVYPRDEGDRFDILPQLMQELSFVHGDEEGPRAWVLEGVSPWFHRKVEDDFSSLGVRFVGDATGRGLQGKDGKGQRGVQTQELLSDPFV
jgi:hypothetical protein